MSIVRSTAAILAAGFAVASVPPAAAAPDPARVREAIARGAEYLTKSRGRGGGAAVSAADHTVGRAALTGMAMLEGGVPADDPAVAEVARIVRGGAAAERQTYDIALAILFLDRLGDATDIPTIQMLGVRLYAGMTATGGWTYTCDVGGPAPPGPAPSRENQLVGQPVGGPVPQPAKPKKDTGFPEVARKADGAAAEPEAGRLNDAAARYYLGVRQALRGGRTPGDGDNSNTQFGLIGLWVASRHGVPANDAFALIDARFLTTQNRADAGWGYGTTGQSTAAMTCAGLLGLAVGGGRGRAELAARQDGPKGDPNDPFFNPPKKDKEAAHPGLPGVGGPPAKKVAIAAALTSLGGAIARARQGENLDHGAGNQFYLLWSLERVGVAYGLTTIGNIDWYEWGTNILLAPGAQAPDGSWTGNSGYGPDVDTSFAILFLAKSNFTRDLSTQLTGRVSDPGTSELRGGGDIALFGAATGKQPPAAASPRTRPDALAGNSPPVVAPAATANTPADVVAESLLTAGADWSTRLEAARDTKGADYTTGLVKAIPLLAGDKQRQARDALAERLTRMTAATLRTMMKDADPELRRGAVLAAAMKDDKAHVPDLIERVGGDSADTVVRAARAGLKSLTSQDFGPAPGAGDTARAKAAADWKKWYDSQAK